MTEARRVHGKAYPNHVCLNVRRLGVGSIPKRRKRSVLTNDAALSPAAKLPMRGKSMRI